MLRHHRLLASLAVASSLVGASRLASADTLDPGPAAEFKIEDYVTGLGQTTDFAFLPDGRTIVTEKDGTVRVRKPDGSVVDAGIFPVNTTSEQGLLSVVVHPDFATNHRLFFYYSAASSAGGTNLDRHRVVSVVLKDDDTIDMSTETILLRGLRGPANHDGGGMAIGPDGKLYVGDGDSGCNSNTPPEPPYAPTNYFGTCLTNGNGKIMRINLDGSIPDDNPLVGVAAVTACGSSCGNDIAGTGTAAPRTDLWAWGFRNPWRFWFDPVTGKQWVGDVGEITYEEVTIVEKGRHHGWPWREGAHGWPTSKCKDVQPDTGDCVEPVYDCSHDPTTASQDGDCKSITGGLIVDSCSWPAAFRGLYFFADNVHATLWTLQPTAARDGIVAKSRKNFGKLDGSIPVAMHLGPDGNLYVAALPGRVVRISPKAPIDCVVPDAGGDVGPVVDTGPKPDTGPRPDTGAGDGAGRPDTAGGDASFDAGGNDGSVPDDGGPSADTGSSGGCGCALPGQGGSDDPRATIVLASALAALVVGVRRRRAR